MRVEAEGFLGMVNYYKMYLPKMSSLTEPLHDLLRKGVPWKWSQECDSVFWQVKKLLCEAPVLALFDMTQPIVVHCDASNYGVGAVLSHVMEDGTEKPVSYASRTLSSAERNYAAVEKEGLALVYAVKKFHQFLFGIISPCTLITNLFWGYSQRAARCPREPHPECCGGLCSCQRTTMSCATVRVAGMVMRMH